MIDRLLEPIASAQLLVALFLAVLFLQSGVDKAVDFSGNLSWLQGHFAKSPLRGQVKPMLATVTVTECAAGLMCAAGAVQLVASGSASIALWGSQLAALNILMLFFGQRIAKDYVGAATLVPYFVLSAGAVILMGQ